MKVLFINFEGDTVALFPDELYNERLYGDSLIVSYEHVGQHGGASVELLEDTIATKEEYIGLLEELKNIGYDNLEVLNEE